MGVFSTQSATTLDTLTNTVRTKKNTLLVFFCAAEKIKDLSVLKSVILILLKRRLIHKGYHSILILHP